MPADRPEGNPCLARAEPDSVPRRRQRQARSSPTNVDRWRPCPRRRGRPPSRPTHDRSPPPKASPGWMSAVLHRPSHREGGQPSVASPPCQQLYHLQYDTDPYYISHCAYATHRKRSVMTSVLIAGGTGMLGRPIASHLLDQPGVDVRLLVRDSSPRDPGKEGAIQHLVSRGASIVAGDVSDSASLDQATQGVDVVISALQGRSEI